MRVIAGQLKGRRIPFNSRRFGQARVTSGRVKEAVFSMLGTDLEGRRFLDLFAGSGQMGLEAYSRGCVTVMNELDGKRHHLILQLLRELDLQEAIALHRQSADRLAAALHRDGERFDVIYLDPPYRAEVSGEPMARWVLEQTDTARLLDTGGVLLLQHDPRVDLPRAAGTLAVCREKGYGDTQISVYASAKTG
jgi:16S rRNA (guanine(966)-N(2))-methyltransferase RsmD